MRFLIFLFICCPALQAQQLLVSPYIQPGNAPSLTREEKVIIWQTDDVAGSFKVEFGTNRRNVLPVTISSTPVNVGTLKTIVYRALLADLQFDETYFYRVSLSGKTVVQSQFKTRSKKPASKFVVFGDCGARTTAEKQIAYRAYVEKPDFVLITGDNVYSRGLMSEYLRNYFPYFNSSKAGADTSAPLMRSTPFYLSIGNHDVGGSNFTTHPDGLAYYYYFDQPLNAPAFRKTVNPTGPESSVAAFKKATAPRFPNMANFSFDNANVHILCLDANRYVYPFEKELTDWIESDLKNSTATWKMVAFHHPGFNSSKAHYNEQWMRALSPIFEKAGVDIVLTGHVHNYQRSYPLKFEPERDAAGGPVINNLGRVDGKFTLDMDYNGKDKKRPDGIVYIVTGAGGASLYDQDFTNQPALWKHDPPSNWVPFTAKFISDIHSYSVIETKGSRLIFRQLDVDGSELDKFEIVK